METKRTIDSIISAMREKVENKDIIYPSWWLEGASSLNLLLSDEHDALFDLQQKVAQKRVLLLEAEENVSRVKLLVEATDEYRDMLKLKAKIGRIEEFIRLAKVQARMRDTDLRTQ